MKIINPFLADANEFIECCTEDGQFPETLVDPTLCMPIRVPENDARIAPRNCLNFVRSVCSLRLDCLPGPIEQVRLKFSMCHIKLSVSFLFPTTIPRRCLDESSNCPTNGWGPGP